MSNRPDRDVVEFIRKQAESDTYAAYCRNILQELMEIDTSPTHDLAKLRQAEAKVFDVIESELKALLGDRVAIERQPIDPAIADDPAYSVPYYATNQATGRTPECEEVYRGRRNLIAIAKPDPAGPTGRAAIYNAHVDVVRPWTPPRADADRLFGRGACDDKGGIAMLLAQVKLLEELREQFGLRVAGERVYQFVIDEESGGNGTLSAVLDPRFAGHEAVVVEATNNTPHPAGRGALWYRCELSSAGNPYVQPLEMYPFVIHALEQEGQELRAESNHPLFRMTDVQTNHGILGCYGSHPSAVNDHVAVIINVRASANPERIAMRAIEIIEAALSEYCARYGDKTKQLDPLTGDPKVAEHYGLRFEPRRDAVEYRLDVHGRAGHMGALDACDGAITKSAYILLALMKVARNHPTIQVDARLADEPKPADVVVLEGAQGFLPTHPITQAAQRLRGAATQGVQRYCEFRRVPFRGQMVRMTFEKLHNDAYASPVDCPAMQAMRAAFEGLHKPWPEPTGWSVSCDARLFAARGHNAITFGPGSVSVAHSAEECIDVRQVQEAVAICTLGALHLPSATGTAG